MVFTSPFSPVFHTVVTVIIGLKNIVMSKHRFLYINAPIPYTKLAVAQYSLVDCQFAYKMTYIQLFNLTV